MTDGPKVRGPAHNQTTVFHEHPISLLHAAYSCLRQRPPQPPSLILVITLVAFSMTVMAHGDVPCLVIGAVAITALVVIGLGARKPPDPPVGPSHGKMA